MATNMIYFIVTTSLFNNSQIRKKQYIAGIGSLIEKINYLNIKNYKIIIVENNKKRDTFLDTLGHEVYYTENNFLPVGNKGYKELQDVLDCIEEYNICDTDFIVKMTGRYILNNNGEFMNIIKNLSDTRYECVIKYGSYFSPVDYKTNDCVTGLIGMTCSYVKQIEKPSETECVEWQWAKITNLIDNDKICIVKNLGIDMCPGGNIYFSC